jgi:hypothetical protein
LRLPRNELKNYLKVCSMTYNAFEQQLYNCDTIEEIVQLCMEYPQLAKEYLERQKMLRNL